MSLVNSISNAPSVIHGNASHIQAESEAFVDQTSAILERVEELQKQAVMAQKFETICGQRELVTRSLRDEIDTAISHFTGQPGVCIRTDVDDFSVEVHPDFNIALRELIENGIIHNETTGDKEITLSTDVTDTHVRLRISDTGPGIPENEIAFFRSGEETDLEHSTGIGLWLVKQLLAQMACSLAIETDSTGTRIDISLPRNHENQ